jgi:rRNA maturation endonuclease Nob1
MSQKEIEKHTCHYCESEYKLLFDLEMTAGNPKFCPFCGSDTYDEKELHFGETIDE